MFNYEKVGLTLKERDVIIKEDKYGYFTAVKVFCEEDYQLLKLYYAEAYSSCWSRTPVSEIAGEYEGPDWYFFEGSPGDRYGPSSYRLESLSFKKKKFEEFCAQYETL